MKKITILLLALLMLASCFAFASCDEKPKCLDGGSHDYTNTYGEPSAYCRKCGAEKEYKTGPSIGETIILGAICLGVGLILHWIGIYNSSAFFLRAPLVVFIILTLGAFLAAGVAQGIIMAVFLVIYIAASIAMNRKYLGYDDYV